MPAPLQKPLTRRNAPPPARKLRTIVVE